MEKGVNVLLMTTVLILLILSSNVANQVVVLRPDYTQEIRNQIGYETLTWRKNPIPTVNFWDGFVRPDDSLAVWFKPLAPCSLIAIRFYPYDFEGTCLINVWDGSHYDGNIITTDSTDSNGWIGDFQNGQWIPGPVLSHSPIGWSEDDPTHHYWGLFPFTVTRLNTGQWNEIPTEIGLQGRVDLGDNPFFISLTIIQTSGTGWAGENESSIPYHFFRYYSLEGEQGEAGPDGEHFGWFIHSASIWIEAVVKYYEPIPGPFISSSLDYNVDDDGFGKSQGNDNELIEPGETIELSVQLVNVGNTQATGVEAVLKTMDSFVTISDSLQSFGDIIPGGTVQSVNDFVFTLLSDSPSGRVIHFSLGIEDTIGNVQHHFLSLEVSQATSIDESNESNILREFHLYQNYPNPFNPQTTIEYTLPEPTRVKVEVYNLLGQVVDVLVDSEMKAGFHKVQWNGKSVSSGMYFYRLTAGSFTELKNMVVLK